MPDRMDYYNEWAKQINEAMKEDAVENRIEGIISHPKSINKVHESVYRSWHILEYVKEYLRTHKKIFDTDHILTIINHIEKGDGQQVY